MSAQFSPLLMIGCGKMGAALLACFARAGVAQAVDVIDPSADVHSSAFSGFNNVRLYPSLEGYFPKSHPKTLLFAVKPQQLEGVLPLYASRFAEKTTPLILSIAAGVAIRTFENHFPDSAVIRAMPNTPARIGQGVTALVAGAKVSEEAYAYAVRLFGAAGAVCRLENEADMHAVTALSGSGPAYMFLILDALIKAGLKAGLSESLARTLAIETMRGSAALAALSPEQTPEALRREVTSPGGTTEAALSALIPQLPQLLEEAVEQAIRRSGELAGESPA